MPPRWLLRCGAYLARLLSVSLLYPAGMMTEDSLIEMERKRLLQMHELGIRVPRIIDDGDKYLVLSDLGYQLHQRMEVAPSAERVTLFLSALEAIHQVHLKSGYLSQAFARNIVVDENEVIGFIDFEDDPGASLSLHDAQIRDLIMFFYSSLYLLRNEKSAVVPQISDVIQRYPKSSQDKLASLVKRLRCLRWIPSFGFLGRDLVRLKFMVSVLEKLV